MWIGYRSTTINVDVLYSLDNFKLGYTNYQNIIFDLYILHYCNRKFVTYDIFICNCNSVFACESHCNLAA